MRHEEESALTLGRWAPSKGLSSAIASLFPAALPASHRHTVGTTQAGDDGRRLSSGSGDRANRPEGGEGIAARTSTPEESKLKKEGLRFIKFRLGKNTLKHESSGGNYKGKNRFVK